MIYTLPKISNAKIQTRKLVFQVSNVKDIKIMQAIFVDKIDAPIGFEIDVSSP